MLIIVTRFTWPAFEDITETSKCHTNLMAGLYHLCFKELRQLPINCPLLKHKTDEHLGMRGSAFSSPSLLNHYGPQKRTFSKYLHKGQAGIHQQGGLLSGDIMTMAHSRPVLGYTFASLLKACTDGAIEANV